MIPLSRTETWLVLGVLLLLVLGQIVRACRHPRLEYVPGRVEAGWKALEADPEHGAPEAPENGEP
jgi:hypothetical protein